MPRIFFFDIDNTLLDHRTFSIAPSTLAAIETIKNKGHTVVIATGRSHEHARPFTELLQPSYTITQNGARILQGEDVVLSQPLPRQALIDLFDWVNALGHHYGVYDGHRAYLSHLIPLTTEPLDAVGMPYQSADKFYLHRDVYQGWLFFDESQDAELIPRIRERHPDFDVVCWHWAAVDVISHNVNKWTGCQWVLDRTGFRSDQAVAFGDGLNDMQMLQGVGLGIAMDNGHPDLKAIADRIAPPVHLDGIALMLNEFMDE